MKLPAIRGTIDRRILINYRVDPAVLAATLPPPFRPRRYRDHALVGICLIRLRAVRPRFLPFEGGISSENAAYRAAVEWEEGDCHCQGVYIHRRETNSRLNSLAGGRIFPGVHSHAQFTVQESLDRFEVAVRSDDGQTQLSVVADLVPELPAGSIFASLAEASRFFENGSLGYSPTVEPQRFEGLRLQCHRWHVDPLALRQVYSSYYDDPAIFPPGSIQFDSALLMRGIEHEWHRQSDLCCAGSADRPTPQRPRRPTVAWSPSRSQPTVPDACER